MRLIKIILSVFLLIGAGDAWGQSCSVIATPSGFGNYDTTSPAPLDTVSEVSVHCESGMPFQIRLDAGQNPTSEFERSMRASSGDSSLAYNLYRDSARTEVWGDGTGNTFPRNGVGTGGPERYTVYGRIPGSQNVRADVYHDSIIVTVEW